MEEDLQAMVENYESEDNAGHVLIVQSSDPEDLEKIALEIAEPSDQVPLESGRDDAPDSSSYKVRDSRLYKTVGDKKSLLANFYLEIVGQQIWVDEGISVRRNMNINIHLNGTTTPLTISSEDFCSHRFVNRIVEGVGPDAIIYGNHRELRLAAQELSPSPVPSKIFTSSMGFNEEGVYLAPGMSISSEGINDSPEIDVDLSEGNFSKNLGFLSPDKGDVKALVGHLHDEFLELKDRRVMYPLLAHVVLSAFASQIIWSINNTSLF